MTARLAVAAGERSGDDLGAAVAAEILRLAPDSDLFGITGPGMDAVGVERVAGIDELDVMGLFEVLKHVPRLYRFRRALARSFVERRAGAFVGLDAPDFNIGLARALKKRGVRAIQVVAPSVWAWRAYRVARIARSLDLLLTLFPFEPEIFRRAGLNAQFIGHPLADALPLSPDRAKARHQLGLDSSKPVIALLPGSRPGEIRRHAALVADTAERLASAQGADTLLLLAEEAHRALFAEAAGRDPAESGMRVACGQTRTGLTASDLALAASGTVTLEALLAKTPLVVFYRLAGSTYQLARALRLVKSKWISLPNVLAGSEIVPERIQHEASADNLAADALAWLGDPRRCERYGEIAREIHLQLARGAATNAAEAILRELSRDAA
ncbi:MAG TPA: lipid-A-disaccharide synthase [Wenzhouxiangellaceae bacterium]|nr:lipid-A-disaccharide synthase [Wenzhouxiangellaceae bacterium]